MDNDIEIYRKIEEYVYREKNNIIENEKIKDMITMRKINEKEICDYLTKFFMTIYIIHNGTTC